MKRIVEVRSYNLKPGTQANFECIVGSVARPMLASHGTDVVAAGRSLVDANSFLLIRAYADATDRELSQAAFYGSTAWREGPRDAVMACIENYTTIGIEADEKTIDGLRSNASAGTLP